MGRDVTGNGVRGGGGDPAVATGCISSVFRFFDFHHFQLCNHLNHQQHGNPEHFDSHSSASQSLKGLEAPRNSFESEESAPSIAKLVSENATTIPQMSVKTKRRPMKANSLVSSEELSEDGFSSPGSRTPSLVARLMGLDLLPEATSPAPSASSAKLHLHTLPTRKQIKNSGTQSLPDSPRISLARWSDVDLHHRLSLQVSSKEGNAEDEVLCKRREMIKSLVQNSEAEGWSPGHYAKQIVKQVKESVGRSRRVGLAEITNTIRCRATAEQRRDEHLLPGAKIKIKTPSPSTTTSTNLKSEEGAENQASVTSSNTHKHLAVSPTTSSITTTKHESMKSFSSKPNTVNEKTAQKLKCRKSMEEKFKFKLTTSSTSTAAAAAATASSKNKKEREPLFIRPSPSATANQHLNKSPLMSKKTPLSTEQFNITSTSTRTSQDRIKQAASECDKHNGNREQLQLEKQNTIEAKTQTVGVHEIQYVSKILKCMGIGNHTRIGTTSNWFSPSHPLNPSIFNLLEPISSSNNLILKCNRRLIFQLADEILADILRPSGCVSIVQYMNGDQLVKVLTTKMECFPLSNCRVLQDVDALVGSDYYRGEWWSALDDEKRSVVREVEREILECLLLETTALL